MLLSGDGLVPLSLSAAAVNDLLTADQQESYDGSLVETSSAIESAAQDPFAGMDAQDESVLGEVTELVSGGAETANEVVAAQETTGSDSSGGSVVVEDVITPTGLNQGDDFTEQLVETLQSPQGPPSQVVDLQSVENDSASSQQTGEAVEGGSFVLADYAQSLETVVVNPGETLGGNWVGNYDIQNNGVVSPGHSPGFEDVVNFSQGAGGTLLIEIAGKTAGTQYDQVRASGLAQLDGTLKVELLNGYVPQVGDTFDIMTYGTVEGKFATGKGLFGFGEGNLYFEVVQGNGKIQLVVKEVSGALAAITPASGTGADAVGQILNHEYFDTATVSFSGTLQVSQFVYVSGSFALSVGIKLVTMEDGSTKNTVAFMGGAADVYVFVGIGGPYWVDSNHDGVINSSDTPDSDGAVGIALENVDVGFAMFKPVSLIDYADYLSLKVTADSAQIVGMDGVFDLELHDIEVGVNLVDDPTDTPLTPADGIDFSAMPGGGLNVPTGGDPVLLDFEAPIIQVFVGDALLQVNQFIFVRGSFAFTKGETFDVTLDDGGTTEVETMTIGASNVHVFAGIGGPYWVDSNNDGVINSSDTPDSDGAIGIALENVDVGMVFMEETSPFFTANYFALKITADSAQIVGIDDILDFELHDIEVGVNMVDDPLDTALTPAPGVDFTAMDGGGLEIETGGDPVLLDFAEPIIQVFVGDALLQVNQFIFVRGSFAFTKGATYEVPLDDGDTTEVETMTIGASNVHVFAGIGGPYWVDSNNDGVINSSDTPDSDGAIGIALENVDVGMVFMEETSPFFTANYFALKITADSAQIVGIDDILDFELHDIEVGVNMVDDPLDTALTPAPGVDFTAMDGGGLEIETGGDPVLLDFAEPIIQVFVGDALLQVNQFIFVRGSFAFTKGATYEVPLDDGDTTEVETMTIGASNVHVFAGIGGPYWVDSNNDGVINSSDTPDSDGAIGIALENVDVGMVFMEETSPFFTANYFALKITADSAQIVGIDDILDFELHDIEVGVNMVDDPTDTALTPAPGVDFTAMDGGGLEIETGGDPVLLDFAEPIIQVFVGDALLQVNQFIFVRGSFAFTKGATYEVPLDDGDTTEVETMTIGASNVHVFAGIGGPYWVDSNNDGVINSSDTPDSDGAIGIALENVDVGMVFMEETSPFFTANYFALKITADSAQIVGIDDILDFELHDIEVGVNMVDDPLDTALTPAPGVDFTAMDGGGLEIETGGDPVLLDFAEPIIQVFVGDALLQVNQFIFVRGSFAFTKGATYEVPLDDGDTTEVETMTIGASNVHVFAGIGGPYWVDSNNDGVINSSDTPDSDGAIGIALENVDVGMVFMEETSPFFTANYFALKITADSAQIVGIDDILDFELHDIEVGVNMVDDPLDTALTPAPGVDFTAMDGGGLEIETGGDPVLLDFAEPIIQVFVGDALLQVNQFIFVRGSFAFTKGATYEVPLDDGDTTEVETMTIGASNVHVFAGIGGPYWVDSNNDGVINSSDTPDSDGAIGIALENVDVGMVFMEETSPFFTANYFALKITADSAQIVGIDDILDFELHDIEVGVNMVDDPLDTALTPAPGVDFTAMDGGGLEIETGGDPVLLDFAEPIIQVFVGDALLQVNQFIFVRGSFAFTKGATYEVPLDDGDTTEVETMTIGASNVHVFAGIGGPYWVDSNNDGVINSSDTPDSDGAIGIALENVDVGMVFMEETSPFFTANYFALKITADSAQIVGIDDILDFELHDIEVGVNMVDDPLDTALTPAPGVDFTAMDGGGLEIETGGDPVLLDFAEPIIQVFVGDALLQVNQFIFVRGSFAFTKGATYEVPLDDGDTTEVETMTIGASNVHVFAGIGGPYWVDSNNDGVINSSDTPDSDGAIGIALENVDVGMVFMEETSPFFTANYFALKITADSAQIVGIDDILDFELHDIEVGVNMVDDPLDTALTPAPGVDFTAMDGGGLEIETGGDPVLLDFAEPIIQVFVGDALLQVNQFIFVRGSFAFTKGATYEVPLDDGDTTEVETMTIGASNVHVFAGIGGPYWVDSNNDGVINSSDTPDSDGAFGIALENVDVGMVFMEETSPFFTANYFALKITADSAGLVGFGDILQIEARDIEVGVNTVDDPLDNPLFPAPGVDFTAMDGGGLEIETGGDPVLLDFAEPIIQVFVGDLVLQVDQFVFVRGSFAFTKGATFEVPLDDGDTTEVETMTVGASNVHVFAGIGGPYWVDSDNDGVINSSDTPDSDGAFGIALENVDVGMVFMQETTPILPAKYFALKITADSAGLVGFGDILQIEARDIEVGINTVDDPLDNPLFPAPGVDFTAMEDGGLEIPTGGDPVVLDFAEPIIQVFVGDLVLQVDQFVFVRGSFAFTKGATFEVPLDDGDTTEVETMTIGASNVHVFAGIGGPYWVDSNNDGVINSSDTPDSDGAFGIALENVDVGMVFMQETTPILPAKYFALKITADSAALVGLGDILQIEARDIEVGINTVNDPLDNPLFPAPGVDFTAMDGGGLEIETGGDPVLLDFAEPIIQVFVGDLILQVSQFVFVRGSFAFTKGATFDVTLEDGDTTEVETMTIGASNVHVFAGIGGPYWVDSNHDGVINSSDTPDSDGALGIALENVDVGMVFMQETTPFFPAKYFALKITADSAAIVGLGDILTFEAHDIEVGINTVNDPLDNPLFPAPGVDFTALEDGGLEIATGGDPVVLDFEAPIIQVFVGDAILQVSQFVFVRGSFAFTKGETFDVTLDDGDTTEVETMTIGASNVHVFAGIGGPYWVDSNHDGVINSSDTPDSDGALGVALQNVDVGIVFMQETTPILPAKYFALKINAESAAFVGFGDILTLEARDIEVGVNTVDDPLDNPLFPAPGVDFSSLEGGGLEVKTGGDPVVLDFDAPILRVSLGYATIRLASFVEVYGSFAIEKGVSNIVTINTGASADLGLPTEITGVEVDTLTIGAANVHAFVGVGGPYFNDSDNDGTITEFDQTNDGAIGFAIKDFDFGLALMKPTLIDIGGLAPKFYALKATAEQVAFVGGGDIFQLEANDVEVSMNGSDTQFPFAPYINFVDSFPAETGDTDGDELFDEPAGLEVHTGGDPVYLNFDSRLLKFETSMATLQIAEFIYVRGAFAFVKGPTQTVTVNTGFGGTFEQEVEFMTIGAADVFGFVGLNGPYKSDTNKDGVIDGNDTVNHDAIGLSLENLDLGIAFMTPTIIPNGESPVKYMALKATTDAVQLVGTGDVITLAGYDVEVAFNDISVPGLAVAAMLLPTPNVNFAETYETAPGAKDGVYELETGADPILMDFDTDIVRLKIGYAEMQVAGIVQLSGSIAFTLGATQAVTLSNGTQKTVRTMMLGMNDIYGFVGFNGPYFSDTNGDHRIDESDTVNEDAVGLALSNLDAGFVFMQSAEPFSDLDLYFAAKLSVEEIALVGIPGIEVSANDFEVQLNIGASVTSGLAVVDFTKLEDGYMEVETGNDAEPVRLDYSGFMIRAGGAVHASIFDVLTLDGAFDFELSDSSGLVVFLDATAGLPGWHTDSLRPCAGSAGDQWRWSRHEGGVGCRIQSGLGVGIQCGDRFLPQHHGQGVRL